MDDGISAWTSRGRLLAALRRRQPDRVPVSLYQLDPFSEDCWQAADPTYDRVRALAQDGQDTIAFTSLDLGFGLGERGVVLYSIGDPLGYALGLMPFDLFVDWTTTTEGRATSASSSSTT